mgnify:CR=1 FL=1
MSFPSGFNPKQSSPEVYIYDYDGVLQYEYQTGVTQASPVQDFRLQDLSFTVEGNGSYGHATLILEDNQGILIDDTKRRSCVIQKEWDIQIKMGKNNAGLSRWFYGKIKSSPVIRPGTNVERIQLTCTGWGEVLKNKITQIKRNQRKTSNGIDLDSTDLSTKLYNLVIDIITKTDHQIDNNIPPITTITAPLAAQGICEECLDISVANVNETGNTYAGFLSRIIGIANADWYIDPDRILVARDSSAHDSGFLITNNLTSLDTVGWDSEKLMFIKNELFSYDDSSFDTFYSWIHGFGHFAPKLDVSETTTPDATDNMDDEWIAIPFTPTQDNIFKLAFILTKTGTPPSNTVVEIRGNDGTGKPDVTDIRRTITITKERLAEFGTSTPGNWYEIPITPKLEVTPNEILFAVFRQYGSVSHTFNIDYKAGSGTYYVSTDGGVTWSTSTGKPNYRVYSAKRLKTSVENTVLSQRLNEQKEKLLPIRADLEEQTVRAAMIVASEILGKERRVYDNIKCTIPDDRIPLNSYCRLVDIHTGLDVKATIVSYTVECHAGDDKTNIGADSVTLTLDDIHTV